MQDFSRKVEETVRQAEERIHQAVPHLNEKIADASLRIEKEAQELIAYLNAEVIPAIRTNSTKALRTASDKLAQLATYIESHHRN